MSEVDGLGVGGRGEVDGVRCGWMSEVWVDE